MSRQFMYGTVMAAAITVGLGAQSSPPQSYPQGNKPQSTTQGKEKTTPRETSSRGQAMTVVGCLQNDESPSGTSATGTTGSSAAKSAKYVLADATQSSTGKSGATGTAGTAGTAASIPSTLHLTASGSSSANWSRYVNHKVEVKGTLQHTMGGAESNPTGNPPSATNPSNPSTSSSDMGETLRVTSIKEVSATCSGSPK